jgi:hypothetical protein
LQLKNIVTNCINLKIQAQEKLLVNKDNGCYAYHNIIQRG